MTDYELEIGQYPMIVPDTLDDGSGVLNFDAIDDNEDQPVATSGYVMARMDEVVGEFIVTVFNADGDVLSETVVPFNFKQ
jgi:hypothetical protein